MTHPAVLEEIREIIEDDDPTHLTCCNENVSMCGLDVSDYSWEEPQFDGQECKLCLYVYNHSMPCPVEGCVPDVCL